MKQSKVLVITLVRFVQPEVPLTPETLILKNCNKFCQDLQGEFGGAGEEGSSSNAP